MVQFCANTVCNIFNLASSGRTPKPARMKRVAATINTVLFEPSSGGGVYLRHPVWADYEAWAALRLESRDYLKPWEPSWDDRHLTAQAYRSRLLQFKKRVASDESYPFHIFRGSDNALVGACNLTQVHRKVQQRVNVGYWVGERFVRQGFARAAVRAACKFSFETLGLHRVEAAVRVENEPSRALLSALGFTLEGLGRGYLKIDGEWRDHELYAKLVGDRERNWP